ncbi:MAG TPA: histidine phosphatase family protein [Acidimicrobiales bacterium]|nr:histidine phosphatase family protein [Acidimicrobiales bacterium]
MARLLLLRHGQSTWNAEHRWQGMADPPLSHLGEQQARRAAAWLAGAAPPLSGVASSDLQRSRRTAEIIAAELVLGEVDVDPALRERDVGDWSGCTSEEIAARWPDDLRAWREGRLTRPPGGEDDASLVARVLPALERLCARPAELVLVVTHGGAIRALERHLAVPSCTPANLCGRWFWREPDTAGALRADKVMSLPEVVELDEEAIAPL